MVYYINKPSEDNSSDDSSPDISDISGDESSSSTPSRSSYPEPDNMGYSCGGCEKKYSYSSSHSKKYYIKTIGDMFYFSLGISVIAFIIMLFSTIKFLNFDYFTYIDDNNNRVIDWSKVGYGCAISFVISCILCMVFCKKLKVY